MITHPRPTSTRHYRKPTNLDQRSLSISSPTTSLQRALSTSLEATSASTCELRRSFQPQSPFLIMQVTCVGLKSIPNCLNDCCSLVTKMPDPLAFPKHTQILDYGILMILAIHSSLHHVGLTSCWIFKTLSSARSQPVAILSPLSLSAADACKPRLVPACD
jgi:hypothetical protein